MKKALEDIAENQKRLANFSERRAAAEERKAQALEMVAACLQAFITKDPGMVGEIERIKDQLPAVSVESVLEPASAPEAGSATPAAAEAVVDGNIRSEGIESEQSWDELTETLATAVEAKVSPVPEQLRDEPDDVVVDETGPDDESIEKIRSADKKVILRKKRVEVEESDDEPSTAAAVENESAQKMTEKDRRKVIRMIINKRKKGLSYEKIAQFLEEKEIRTFSGKGQWRGQTVHRIYRQNMD